MYLYFLSDNNDHIKFLLADETIRSNFTHKRHHYVYFKNLLC